MIDLNDLRRDMLRGGIPSLVEGVRPDAHEGINSVAFLKSGVSFVVRPSPIKRESWASSKRHLVQAYIARANPGLVERVSHEQELCEQIESAIETGCPMEGFLSMTRTLSGAVSVLPCKGKREVYRDALTLARLLDRGALFDPLEALGLGDPKPAAKPTAKPMPKQGKKWAVLRPSCSRG